jgi:hypothetical protein
MNRYPLPFVRRSIAAAVLAFGAVAPAFASSGAVGEAMPAELPSMATPTADASLLSPMPGFPQASRLEGRGDGEAIAPELHVQAVDSRFEPTMSRAEVRDQLDVARYEGLMGVDGEISETPEVLAWREQYAAAEAERITAEYERVAEAERLRAEADEMIASQMIAAPVEEATLLVLLDASTGEVLEVIQIIDEPAAQTASLDANAPTTSPSSGTN